MLFMNPSPVGHEEWKMISFDYLEFLFPGESLKLHKDRLKQVRVRRWTYFRKLKRNGKVRLLLLNKGKPLVVNPDDIDWGDYRK